MSGAQRQDARAGRIASLFMPALLALSIVAVSGAANAATLDVEIAGHAIVLPIPAGYCALDRSREADRELDERIERVMSTRDLYLGAALDCAELAALEDAPEEGFTTYLIWLAAGDGNGGPALFSDLGRADFIESAAEEAPSFDKEAISEEAAAAWRAELDSDEVGFETLEMGVVGTDENAYYLSFVARIVQPGGAALQAGVTAGTLIHGAHIIANLYRPFDGASTLAALEPEAKTLAAILIAANPDSDPGAGALGIGRSAGFAGIRGAIAGALAGAAIGIAVWLVRRSRRPRSRHFG